STRSWCVLSSCSATPGPCAPESQWGRPVHSPAAHATLSTPAAPCPPGGRHSPERNRAIRSKPAIRSRRSNRGLLPSHLPLMSQPALRVAGSGGGPAGLMAAEVLAQAGLSVDPYDAMPSVGRKFLLAGVGGMIIPHSERREAFLSRYGE